MRTWQDFIRKKSEAFIDKKNAKVKSKGFGKKTWSFFTKEDLIRDIEQKTGINQNTVRSILNGYLVPSFATQSLLKIMEYFNFTSNGMVELISLIVMEKYEISTQHYRYIKKAVREVADNYENVPYLNEFVKKKIEKLKSKEDDEKRYKSHLFKRVKGIMSKAEVNRILKNIEEKSFSVSSEIKIRSDLIKKVYILFKDECLPSLVKSAISPSYFQEIKNRKK